MSEKLTPAQRKLLGDVGQRAGAKTGDFTLRDMRRNRSSIALERLGLIQRDYPEKGAWPGKVRIAMRITPAGRTALNLSGGGEG